MNERPRRAELDGVGLGLRWDFLDEVIERAALPIPFFEHAPENALERGGAIPRAIAAVKERYPLITHGLSLSLTAADEPYAAWLRSLRAELRSTHAPWHSEHLCFSSAGSTMLHELMPPVRSRAEIERLVPRLQRVQDALGVPLAVENITTYFEPTEGAMSEGEFMSELLDRSGCWLLFDVNNLWVNAQNHAREIEHELAGFPLERAVQLHLAGPTRRPDGLLVDTHGTTTPEAVRRCFELTLARTGPIPVVLERDHDVPELDTLLDEVAELQSVYERALLRGGAR